jgi:hypothetical protein
VRPDARYCGRGAGGSRRGNRGLPATLTGDRPRRLDALPGERSRVPHRGHRFGHQPPLTSGARVNQSPGSVTLLHAPDSSCRRGGAAYGTEDRRLESSGRRRRCPALNYRALPISARSVIHARPPATTDEWAADRVASGAAGSITRDQPASNRTSLSSTCPSGTPS